MGPIHVKRVYDPDLPREGEVFLVDRLWPRGIRKDAVHLTGWVREAAPSDELRRLFHRRGADFAEFVARYHEQLDATPATVEPLLAAANRGPVTLLFASRDREHNNAVALREYVIRRLR